MPVSLNELDKELKNLLKPEQFKDYCPNGIQVEGRSEVSKIVTGVTANKALIDAAIATEADLILVHHGYFWRGEDQSITGIKKARIESLLGHDISLLAYHLPLDAHTELGNNAQLAKILDFEVGAPLDSDSKNPIVFSGRLPSAMNFSELKLHIQDKLNREPLGIDAKSGDIELIAWCTGAAQNYIELAVEAGVDAYISGEISEQTVHIAKEAGLTYFSAGHHATERYGVQAVGEHLAAKYSIEHEFIDIDNPV